VPTQLVTYSASPYNKGWDKYPGGRLTALHVEGQDQNRNTIKEKKSPINKDRLKLIRKKTTYFCNPSSVKGSLAIPRKINLKFCP